jgi:hypothetical protein
MRRRPIGIGVRGGLLEGPASDLVIMRRGPSSRGVGQPGSAWV